MQASVRTKPKPTFYMKHKEIKDDIVSLLEKIIERAHRINRRHPSGELLLDIDLVKDDLRSLYRCFDMLARLSNLPDIGMETLAGYTTSHRHTDRTIPEERQDLQYPAEDTAYQGETVSQPPLSSPAGLNSPEAESGSTSESEESFPDRAEQATPPPIPPFEKDAPKAEPSDPSGIAEPSKPEPSAKSLSSPAEQYECKDATADGHGRQEEQAGGETRDTDRKEGDVLAGSVRAKEKSISRQMVIPVQESQWEAETAREELGQQPGDEKAGTEEPGPQPGGAKTPGEEPGQQPGDVAKRTKNNNNQKAVIDILSEYSQRTIGDQYLKEEDDSLHQRISGQKEDRSIGARMQQHPVGDLKDVIGVNEKFLFINELFGGDIQDYRKAIAELNGMDGIRPAFDCLNRMAVEYAWDAARSAATIEKLANYVQRRHMSRD